MSTQFPQTAPNSAKELFVRMRAVISHGWYEIPSDRRFKGTGGSGCLLEALLGSRAGKCDIADSTGWEVKTYTDKTNLITLFHKEAHPVNIMRHMVRKWGWKDKLGRMSFRHTIAGRSDRFKVESDGTQVTVRPLKANGPVPYWTYDDLYNAASKLRRVLLVKAEKDGQRVKFVDAVRYENFQVKDFVYQMTKGTVCVDFDAREASPGSGGLRNHGTKFRVSPLNIGRLYHNKQPLG